MTSGHSFFLRSSAFLLTIILLRGAVSVQASTIQAQFPYSSSAAVEIDPSTGTANYSIPLRVPPGRGAVSPEFALTYNSSQGNGMFGVGWSHTIGYIERSTTSGVPRYDGSDTYQLVLAGASVRLVFDAATNRYYPEVDSGQQRIRQTGGYWELTDTTGTVFLFGQTSAARIYDPGDAGKVFRWALERVRDVSGNEMELTYTRDGGWLYPDEIRYAANSMAGLDPYAVISFELQSGYRTDTQLSYHPGFAVRLRKRVAAIQVTADGHPYARYDLHYESSPNTQRSLLAQVDLDQGAGANPVPPVRFNYQSQRGFSRDTSWSIPSGMEFYSQIEFVVQSGQTESFLYHDKGVRQVDINNDGWMDLIRSVQGGPKRVYINNGDNTYTNDVTRYPAGAPSLVEPSGNLPLDTGVRFVDINGDGRLDMVQNRETLAAPQGVSWERRVFLGQANGWSGNQSQWYLPTETPLMQKICSLHCFQYYVGTMLVDIDNDGRVDVVRSHMESDTHVVYRNNGSGWVKDNTWQLPASTYTDLTDGATVADLNGDRLPDIFYLKDNDVRVFMNEGDGWFEDTASPWAQTYPFYDIEDGSTQLTDVNGDGLADLVHGRKVSTGGLTGGTYDKEVRINTGSGWWQDPAYNVDALDFRTKGTRLFDADGDGLTDFMTNIPSDPRKLYLNTGRTPDLMVQVDNGLGGTRTIEYVPSTYFAQDLMPFARPVVRRMTHALAHTSEAYVTDFEYHDGRYSASERQFLGFGRVVTKDTHGNAVETMYHTDPVKQGRPIEQRVYDSNDVLFGKTSYEWAVEPVVAGSDFVYLKRTDNFVYDGDPDGRRTAEEHTYSEHMPGIWLLDQTVQYGEVDFETGVDIGSDHRSAHHEYVSNPTAWLIGLPSKSWTFDDQGQYADYSEFIYDGTAAAGEEPTLGRLTTRRDWHSDLTTYGFQVPTHYEYSACGNLIRTIDAYGAESRMTYDTDYEVFPLVTENDKDHAVTRTYFGVNGEGLVTADGLSGRWGQLKSTTDPNAQTERQDHDDMGRVSSQITSLDSVSFPTQRSAVTYTPTHIRHHVAARQRHGESGTVDKVDFYDALGRKIQTKTPSGEPGQYIVSQQVEYNERGLPVKAYLPFYTTNDLHTIDPIDPNTPHVRTEYDAMGRVVRVIHPDGVTYTNMEYDDWTTTAYDENGAQAALLLRRLRPAGPERSLHRGRRPFAGLSGRALSVVHGHRIRV